MVDVCLRRERGKERQREIERNRDKTRTKREEKRKFRKREGQAKKGRRESGRGHAPNAPGFLWSSTALMLRQLRK